MLYIKLKDRKTNIRTRGKIKIMDTTDHITHVKWSYVEHVVRQTDECLNTIIHNGDVDRGKERAEDHNYDEHTIEKKSQECVG